MNRKLRRAMQRGGNAGDAPFDADAALTLAVRLLEGGETDRAENLCRDVLAREPQNAQALNLLGLSAHRRGQDDVGIKWLRRSVKADPNNASIRKNLAIVLESAGRADEAIKEYRDAIMLGFDAENVILSTFNSHASGKAAALPLDELAGDLLLRALLTTRSVCNRDLERFLTTLRRQLLGAAEAEQPVSDAVLAFFAALAQQCFINEYLFAVTPQEELALGTVRGRLDAALARGERPRQLDVTAMAAYQPLHRLSFAKALLANVPKGLSADLVAQQLKRPLDEQAEASTIPSLTGTEDSVEAVRQQYEDNPYPRWAAAPDVKPIELSAFLKQNFPDAPVDALSKLKRPEMLIAGCGTGLQSVSAARMFPTAKILAFDLSLASLAYAKRKTREAQLRNVDYARADILQLGNLKRSFDVIDSPGVLHHLPDPEGGWRILLSLLRRGGVMRVGLYSAIARETISKARDRIAERGYAADPAGIRAAREMLVNDGVLAPEFAQSLDFFSMSGCRDLLFNVIEHQFTVERIRAFVEEEGLRFFGFEVSASIRQQFQVFFGRDAKLDDLSRWQRFEECHPMTFAQMYIFWLQRPEA